MRNKNGNKKWLNTTITRRDAIVATAKVGAAVTLAGDYAAFATTAQAQDTPIPKDANGETVRYSACLVNCGSRCPLKVIVENDRIVRIEPEDAKDDAVFGEHQIRPRLRGRSSRWRVYSPDRIKYPMKEWENAAKENLNVFHGMRPRPLLRRN